jgi:hypothetical protein
MSITWHAALFGEIIGALGGIIVALIVDLFLSPGVTVAFLIGELAGGLSALTGVWLGTQRLRYRSDAKYGLRREFR